MTRLLPPQRADIPITAAVTGRDRPMPGATLAHAAHAGTTMSVSDTQAQPFTADRNERVSGGGYIPALLAARPRSPCLAWITL